MYCGHLTGRFILSGRCTRSAVKLLSLRLLGSLPKPTSILILVKLIASHRETQTVVSIPDEREGGLVDQAVTILCASILLTCKSLSYSE